MLLRSNHRIMHANVAAYLAFTDACNRPAGVIAQAMPQLPGTLEGLHVRERRDVLVRVSVDARGQVTFVKLVQPAKNRDLDSAAVRAAYVSRYSPAMVRCRPKPGDTFVRVTYDPSME
jgi:TonB family protein